MNPFYGGGDTINKGTLPNSRNWKSLAGRGTKEPTYDTCVVL